MTKTLKAIKNFFLKIWNFVDRKIIVPITKLVLKITGSFDKSSKKLENWLSKTNTLLFVSLFLAVAIFIVIDRKIIFFSENSAEVLRNREVQAIYNEEAYVVEGLPETVDITLIGSKTNLYMASQSPAGDIIVDLNGLKPGSHKVEIKYDQVTSSIDYKVNPSVATVIIYQKMSETKTLTYDVLNQDKLDSKLVINNVKIDTDKVVIKGADYQLKKVATVKALIDINNIVKQEVGTTTLKDVPLKAYDHEGNVVDVEIVPTKIDAEIEIASPSKTLPIKVVPVGEVAFGQAISSMDVNETEVTVYGTEEALANLTYIPVEIDVNELKENHQYKLELESPVGIKSMSVKNVTVNVVLGTVADKDIENIRIDVRNLKEGYSVQGLTDSDIKVTVNVKGVSTVLDQITTDDITAYIDLKDIELNSSSEDGYEVDVQVEGTDARVQYLVKTKKVKIRIIKNN